MRRREGSRAAESTRWPRSAGSSSATSSLCTACGRASRSCFFHSRACRVVGSSQLAVAMLQGFVTRFQGQVQTGRLASRAGWWGMSSADAAPDVLKEVLPKVRHAHRRLSRPVRRGLRHAGGQLRAVASDCAAAAGARGDAAAAAGGSRRCRRPCTLPGRQCSRHACVAQAGLVYSEKGNLAEVLCKPKLIPIKSRALLALEQKERELVGGGV